MRAPEVALLVVGLVSIGPTHLAGQVRGSERAIVSQVSNGTTVTINYARPHVRDRGPVFGGLVGWGHVWTPGANEATTFETTKDVSINGVSVPQGLYSVWMIPSQSDWEMILDPRPDLYHTQPPEPRPDHIRLVVTPEESAHVEALTFDFPLVDPSGMALRFRWGATSVPLRIDVPSPAVRTVGAAEAATMVGAYEMTFAGPPPPGAPPGAMPPAMSVVLTFDGERLVGAIEGSPPGLPSEFALIPVADQIFNPAWLMNGEVFETEVDMFFEFSIVDGTAGGFDVRGLEDRLMMRATRVRQ
jgi:hypothetical protein